MNRRGLFGALGGGIAAALGLRAPAKAPWAGRRILMLKGASMGKTETVLQTIGDAIALPGTAPWRTTRSPWLFLPLASDVAPAPPSKSETSPAFDDLPVVWPGHTGTIAATAALPPLSQFARLTELFGASGEDAPAFAAALIGELVVTRLRLADLRAVHAPADLPS